MCLAPGGPVVRLFPPVVRLDGFGVDVGIPTDPGRRLAAWNKEPSMRILTGRGWVLEPPVAPCCTSIFSLFSCLKVRTREIRVSSVLSYGSLPFLLTFCEFDVFFNCHTCNDHQHNWQDALQPVCTTRTPLCNQCLTQSKTRKLQTKRKRGTPCLRTGFAFFIIFQKWSSASFL